jgi:hypothetical protein
MTIKNIHAQDDTPYYAATVKIAGIKHVVFGPNRKVVRAEAELLCTNA